MEISSRNTLWMMDHRNVDNDCWFLCMTWVADVMNRTCERSLVWRPPLEVLSGQTIDISVTLCFLFWDVVYVDRIPGRTIEDQDQEGSKRAAAQKRLVGSSEPGEIRGRFVGIAHSVGHAMMFRILLNDTRKVVSRSKVRLANVGENNLRADMAANAVPERHYIRTKRREDDVLPTIDISTSPYTVEDVYIFEDDFDDEDYNPDDHESDSSDSENDSDDCLLYTSPSPRD